MPWRIAHLDTERPWRGGERQLLLLAEGLRRRGHVNLVGCVPHGALAVQARAEGFPVYPLRAAFEGDPWAAWNLRRWLRREHIQLVHAHTAHTAALAALARRGTPMKLVLSRRVDFPLRTTFFSPWKYGQADRIIAVSDAVRRVLLKGGVSGERVVIIPDGVVSESPAADRTDGVTFPSGSLRTMLGVAPETSVVGIVAALAPHKDYPTFLRAAERVADQIPSVHFVIVGEGHLRSTLEAEASRRGLASRVHFLGFREDTRPLMIAFDVVVLSSKEEGLGSVLLEAMALGKPIAATTAGGIPEVVADGKTGLLVPPRDPQALADVILRLLRDSTLREQLGEAARIAVQRFSVDRMVDATERVYAEILGGGGGQKRSERSHAHRQTASRVSAVVMTKNEEHNIEECLKRLTWTDEIVVVDDCSTDRTIAGARRFTSKVIQHRGEGFGPQKQFAIDQAQGEWVLLIDADERVSPALAEEIRRILARGSQEGGALVENGFFIPFQLVFLGRRLRFGGLGRERHLRLFRKTAARIVFRPVHEEIVVSAPVGTLSSSIEHESYRDLKEYWSKCDWYTTLAAQGLLAEGARAHWWDRLHVPWELFRRVVLYGAWLDGWRGLVYAGLSAYYVWLKYQKLRRLSPHAR